MLWAGGGVEWQNSEMEADRHDIAGGSSPAEGSAAEGGAGAGLDAAETLAERIGGWIGGLDITPGAAPATDDDEVFERLALEAFALQYERLLPFRRLCDARGVRPGKVAGWRDIPVVPVMAFKSLELRTAPAREIFRSSGTTGGARSVHHHPFPGLYRRVIDATFPRFCLVGLDRPPMLALVPPRSQVDDSSLGFMIDHVVHHFSGDDSLWAFGPAGVEPERAGAWLERRARDGRPAMVIATSFALAQWLEALAARAEGGRPGEGGESSLPPGSVVFDTGGFKGRTKELSREALQGSIARWLRVPKERLVREYGMTELTSQLYTRSLLGGDREHFVAPPWLRPRVLDPETLQELPDGRRGVVALFDLANVGSAIHVVTQDLGRIDAAGLRLEGRAEGADLRGCSLSVEELGHGGFGE